MLKPETIHNIEIVLARYGNSFDLGKASDREKLATEIWDSLVTVLNREDNYNYQGIPEIINKGDDIEYKFISPNDPGDKHQARNEEE